MSWEVSDVATLKRMAIEGHTAEDVALTLKKRRYEIDALAQLLEVAFGEPTGLEWCVRCGNEVVKLHPKTGWCMPCTTKVNAEAQRIADDEERERLEAEARKEGNRTKKERERMREVFGANPRKKPQRPPA